MDPKTTKIAETPACLTVAVAVAVAGTTRTHAVDTTTTEVTAGLDGGGPDGGGWRTVGSSNREPNREDRYQSLRGADDRFGGAAAGVMTIMRVATGTPVEKGEEGWTPAVWKGSATWRAAGVGPAAAVAVVMEVLSAQVALAQ